MPGAISYLLGLAAAAGARPMVVPPMLDNADLPSEVRTATVEAIRDAVAEMEDVDEVVVLETFPQRLTRSCLSNERCLERIAVGNDAPQLIATRAFGPATEPELALVYYRGGRIVRTASTRLQGGTAGWLALREAVYEVVTGAPAPDRRRVGSAPDPSGDGAVLPIPRARSTWQLTVRGGWTRYGAVDFLAGGVELRRRLAGPLSVVGGLEGLAVERTLPPDLQLQEDATRLWTVFFPLNLGAVVRPERGVVRPYAGADLMAARYLSNRPDWALAIRARLGADTLLATRGGVNVDLTLGRWSARRFDLLEAGAPDAAWSPRLTAGVFFHL